MSFKRSTVVLKPAGKLHLRKQEAEIAFTPSLGLTRTQPRGYQRKALAAYSA